MAVFAGFLTLLAAGILLPSILGRGEAADPDGGEGPVLDAPYDPRESPEESGDAVRIPVKRVRAENPEDPPGGRVASLVCREVLGGRRIEGVRAFDMEAGKNVGTSDARGVLVFRGAEPGALVLWGPGLFARLIPASGRRALRVGKQVEVDLLRDVYSIPIRVETAFRGGKPPAEGRIELEVLPRGEARESPRSFPTAARGTGHRIPSELREAWELHSILIPQCATGDRAWFVGDAAPLTLPPGGGVLVLPHRGEYEIRARFGEEWIAQASCRVGPGGDRVCRLRFHKGGVLDVLVQSGEAEPIEGARVRLEWKDTNGPLVREAFTEEDGFVRFRGVRERGVPLMTVAAKGYAQTSRKVEIGGREAVVVRLRALPRRNARAIVCEAGSLRPLAGVRLTVEGIRRKQGIQSMEDGVLVFEIPLEMVVLLRLSLPGYLPYVEILRPRWEPLPDRFLLVPENRDRQLALGLIAVVRGRILGSGGTPISGVPIGLAVSGGGLEPAVPGKPFRIQVRGARPEEVLRSVTDREGRFLLVSRRFGSAVLHWGERRRELRLEAGRLLVLELEAGR